MAASDEKRTVLQRLTLFFFGHRVLTAVLALLLVGYGVLSYTTLLRREGFPPISIPYAMAQGTYLVNDPAQVDRDVAKPISDFLTRDASVESVSTKSLGNFFVVIVQYGEGTDAESKSAVLQDEIEERKLLPSGARFDLTAAKFGFTERGDDAVISFYNTKQTDLDVVVLNSEAKKAVKSLVAAKTPTIEDISLIDVFAVARNPVTGEASTAQQSFERYAERTGSETAFYSSIPIGLTMKEGQDTLHFDDDIQALIANYNAANKETGYAMRLSASFAPSIRQQVSELQKALLEGLLAVLVIGSIIIAIRASLITVVSMVSVIAITLGVLHLIDYTLNTITLFSLILGLSLIVDDTIIMVEALDAQRRRLNDRKEIVSTAVKKVGGAMIAATSTAALSFAPLLFVGGIIGSFVRALPVTIISALIISLFVALILIPFLARFTMLGKNQLGPYTKAEASAEFEARVARFISAPMLWAQFSRKKLAAVCGAALLVSLLFIGGSLIVAQQVKFNIFPPSKDSNQLIATLSFPSGTSLPQAEQIVDRANRRIAGVLGDTFDYAAHYGQANAQRASLAVTLTDYKEREETAPQLQEQLTESFKDFEGASLSVTIADVGPPPTDFAAQIRTDQNREGALRLADDVAAFLKTADIRRPDDSRVRIERVSVDNSDVYTRKNGTSYVGITATYVDTDTTALLGLTQNAIEKEYDADKIRSYGLDPAVLSFDFGQESDNQQSFKTMAYAFPIILLVIYVLLAIQFRSLLQPLLIFLAIPFSLLGVTMGLWLSDNSFSFFALLGFFALIGLSIKNTILLTDYANQARHTGLDPVNAAHEALAERFRPLIATSLTAIVSLIPLALSSPFWQGLSVVLIFGLLSSTFLVVTVFPYYFVVGEIVRAKSKRAFRRLIRRTA